MVHLPVHIRNHFLSISSINQLTTLSNLNTIAKARRTHSNSPVSDRKIPTYNPSYSICSYVHLYSICYLRLLLSSSFALFICSLFSHLHLSFPSFALFICSLFSHLHLSFPSFALSITPVIAAWGSDNPSYHLPRTSPSTPSPTTPDLHQVFSLLS